MLVSSISLVSFLGLVAYDAGPVGVLVVAAFVVLVMFLQFIAYGMHQFLAFALHIGRAVADLTVDAVRGLRGLASRA